MYGLKPLERVESAHTVEDLERFTLGGIYQTLDQVGAIVSTVRQHWGDYGYRVAPTAVRGIWAVRWSDGAEFYLAADRWGNVSEVVPSE